MLTVQLLMVPVGKEGRYCHTYKAAEGLLGVQGLKEYLAIRERESHPREHEGTIPLLEKKILKIETFKKCQGLQKISRKTRSLSNKHEGQ